MRLAFYAPLKPPDHPVPSGDRRMARLLIRALEQAGHEVELASRLPARDSTGTRQAELAQEAEAECRRLLTLYRSRPAPERPAAWLTYHAYYKAPDWIGPPVARALAIPYLIAEASVANKRAGGPYDLGHQAILAAVAAAARIFIINPADRECLAPLVEPRRLVDLPPFLDVSDDAAPPASRAELRRALAERHRLDGDQTWLLAVAMMRPGDKLASYRVLGQALAQLLDIDWQLLVAGDGPARPEVETALAPLGPTRVHYLGRLEGEALTGCLGAADLCVWPAINEAYGMALLEAQAAGLPVVAGAVGGVPSIVREARTGVLTPPGHAGAFAGAVRGLIQAPRLRGIMAANARLNVRRHHDIAAAAATLDRTLRDACAEMARV
jgi:glycosyltransferase involved in cell wall biosynthesis